MFPGTVGPKQIQVMEESKDANLSSTPLRPSQIKVVDINDYQLWKEFKSGDQSAYALIYRKYFFDLYKYGKKISDDKELIKDCIQDLFIKIWNNRENLSDTNSVRYYLFTSLKYKLIDTLRSPHLRLKADEEIMDFHLTDNPDAEDDGLYAKREKVLKTLNKLSKHQQRVLQMKFFQNQSNQEIAAELGITIQAVYNAVFKTLKILRKQLLIFLLYCITGLF